MSACDPIADIPLHRHTGAMNDQSSLERCPGCGGEFAPRLGVVHRYMTSSPACWAAFGIVLAAEYAEPELMPVHRLSVDAFAVQHPGDGSRQAIQSVGLHLSRLHMQLEAKLTPSQANEFMLRAGRRKEELPVLAPPNSFKVTVAKVAPVAGTAAHEPAVREWAESAWADWVHVHDFIRRWAATA